MLKVLKHMVAGVLAALAALEILLRILPVSSASMSGYHIHPKILGYPPHHSWSNSSGWDLKNAQVLRSNNFGFVADHDFIPGSDAVALVGDSYVEANMLPAPERPAAQLERLLHGRQVYAMGGPGSSLLDYAERIAWARHTLGTKDIVLFLSHSDAQEALCGSGNVHSECLDPQTLQPRSIPLEPPGRLKSILRHSALAQYLSGHLRLSPSRLLQSDFWSSGTSHPVQLPSANAAAPAVQTQSASYPIDVILDAFDARIDPAVKARLVVLVHMDHHLLQNSRGAVANRGPSVKGNELLVQGLRSRGYRVVDAGDILPRFQAGSTLSLNVGPYDGHLNSLGFWLLMESVAPALAASGSEAS